MSKYRRQHSSGNLSKGAFWILFAGAVAYGIFKVVIYVRNINEVREMENEGNKYNNSNSYIIITDSAGKKDTQLIQDPLEIYDPLTDTIKKPSRTPD